MKKHLLLSLVTFPNFFLLHAQPFSMVKNISTLGSSGG